MSTVPVPGTPTDATARALEEAGQTLHRNYKRVCKSLPSEARKTARKLSQRAHEIEIPPPLRVVNYVHDTDRWMPLEDMTAVVQGMHARGEDPGRLWIPLTEITPFSVAYAFNAPGDPSGEVTASFIHDAVAGLCKGTHTKVEDCGFIRLPHGHGLPLPRSGERQPDELAFILPVAVTGDAFAVFHHSRQAEQLAPGDAILYHRAEPLHVPPIEAQRAYVFALASHRPDIARVGPKLNGASHSRLILPPGVSAASARRSSSPRARSSP